MTTSLSRTQAELPELVERASRGEDVIIEVDGKPKAVLTRAGIAEPRALQPDEVSRWVHELSEHRSKLFTGKYGPLAEQLIAEDRAER